MDAVTNNAEITEKILMFKFTFMSRLLYHEFTRTPKIDYEGQTLLFQATLDSSDYVLRYVSVP